MSDTSRPNGSGDLIRLGGLWRKTGRDGKTFLSGSIGQAGLLIFSNTKKSKDTDPDYVCYVAPGREREAKPANEMHHAPAQADHRL